MFLDISVTWSLLPKVVGGWSLGPGTREEGLLGLGGSATIPGLSAWCLTGLSCSGSGPPGPDARGP